MLNSQFLIFNLMKKFGVVGLLTSILIMLLMYTGVSKLADFDHFKRSIHLQHFPLWLEHLSTFALPVSEILVAVLMVFERTRFTGLVMSLGMLTIFTGYIVAIMLHVLNKTPCPCGGAIATLTWPQHLCLNLLFMAINGIAILLNHHKITRAKSLDAQ
ncbi:hypothetical protein A0256_00130 [Mucilaginibacter sp. PAMC 26640]|nr:hypothetical protein A0256_00130 [Mucilaginibacter sp. PAMC 26640]